LFWKISRADGRPIFVYGLPRLQQRTKYAFEPISYPQPDELRQDEIPVNPDSLKTCQLKQPFHTIGAEEKQMVGILEGIDVFKATFLNVGQVAGFKYEQTIGCEQIVHGSKLGDRVEEVTYDIAVIDKVEFSVPEIAAAQRLLPAGNIEPLCHELRQDRIRLDSVRLETLPAGLIEKKTRTGADLENLSGIDKSPDDSEAVPCMESLVELSGYMQAGGGVSRVVIVKALNLLG